MPKADLGSGTVWMITANTSTLAAGFETNAIGDNTIDNGGKATARFIHTTKKIVEFDEPATGPFVKLVETSSQSGQPFGGAGEIRLSATCSSGSTPAVPSASETPRTPTDPDGHAQFAPAKQPEILENPDPPRPTQPPHPDAQHRGPGKREGLALVGDSQYCVPSEWHTCVAGGDPKALRRSTVGAVIWSRPPLDHHERGTTSLPPLTRAQPTRAITARIRFGDTLTRVPSFWAKY